MKNIQIKSIFLAVLLIISPITRADTIKIINYGDHLPCKLVKCNGIDANQFKRSVEKIESLMEELDEEIQELKV